MSVCSELKEKWEPDHSGRNEAMSRGCVKGFTDVVLGDVADRIFFSSGHFTCKAAQNA